MSDIWILFACFGFLGMLTLIVVVIVGLRYLNYRETLALAEKGILRPARPDDGKGTLRWGILIGVVGLALSCGLWPLGAGPGVHYPLGLGPWMLAGFLPLFFGLGLILIYFLSDRKPKQEPLPPATPQPPIENPENL